MRMKSRMRLRNPPPTAGAITTVGPKPKPPKPKGENPNGEKPKGLTDGATTTLLVTFGLDLHIANFQRLLPDEHNVMLLETGLYR